MPRLRLPFPRSQCYLACVLVLLEFVVCPLALVTLSGRRAWSWHFGQEVCDFDIYSTGISHFTDPITTLLHPSLRFRSIQCGKMRILASNSDASAPSASLDHTVLLAGTRALREN
jgi:hypothetical protein